MGKSAKFYKRPTKKEKLGLSSSKSQSSIQKNLQRNAPISAQFQHESVTRIVANGHTGPSKAALELEELAAARPRTAVEQKAQKLLLEAEKRALSRQTDAEGDGMDEDGVEAGGARKKTTGASGMKAKARKRAVNGDTTGSKVDYVDLFDGRRSKQ